jgi:hypothetical protein
LTEAVWIFPMLNSDDLVWYDIGKFRCGIKVFFAGSPNE